MTSVKELTSTSAEQTMYIAEYIGANLRGGECIELISDVGGGKTTFVRGLAAGTGSKDHVSSPTFTVSKVYKTPEFNIVHFDFYRLHEPGLIEHELEEIKSEGNIVIVVEWSDIVAHVLPEDRLKIEIKSNGEDERLLKLSYSSSLAYLTENVK